MSGKGQVQTEETNIPDRVSGMCKGLWEGIWNLPEAERRVVGLEQRELGQGRWQTDKPREEGLDQVMQALSSTFQSLF